MGTLTLPPAGRVYLDANAFIYSVEKIEPYTSQLYPLWVAARAGQIQVLSSELTLLEVMVKPYRGKDRALEGSFRDLLLGSREVALSPVDLTVLDEAARLRALTGLKTPDAIHAATALLGGCALFVTNDAAFRRVPGLRVAVLFEIAAAP